MSIARGQLLAAAQGGVGFALLARPGRALDAFAAPDATYARRVARILGARLAVQAAALQLSRNRAVLVTTGWVDAVHALSMVMVAARSARWRRAALASGAFAAAGALATGRAIRRQ
ncbi:MAG: hypothetical protein ABI140_21880 [Jatrophihabitantaceae bacterium]